MAVNDLFRGRNLDDVVDRLAELWEILFRVRDDTKVRCVVKKMLLK